MKEKEGEEEGKEEKGMGGGGGEKGEKRNWMRRERTFPREKKMLPRTFKAPFSLDIRR